MAEPRRWGGDDVRRNACCCISAATAAEFAATVVVGGRRGRGTEEEKGEGGGLRRRGYPPLFGTKLPPERQQEPQTYNILIQHQDGMTPHTPVVQLKMHPTLV